jgi:hypothetical protein
MRTALLALLIAGCGGRPSPPATPTARAVEFLLMQQDRGLWKSREYTVFGSGQALTPFVLYALSFAPAEELAPHRKSIDRALDLLPLEGGEVPTYALALSILALRRFGRGTGDLEERLRALQYTEAHGWSEGDPEYGGWDHGHAPPKKAKWLRPDLSATAFAVEALGGDAKARRFALRCRAADGGFFFTPNPEVAYQNKGGEGRAYATATCDALRILGDDAAARAWLEKNPGIAGLPADWGEALYYYHAFVRSRVQPSEELRAAVRARQQPDGSWRNGSALMKEDDPLIATGFALIVLGR